MIRIRLIHGCYVGGAKRNAGDVLEITDKGVESVVRGLVLIGYAVIEPDEPVQPAIVPPKAIQTPKPVNSGAKQNSKGWKIQTKK